MPVEGAAIVFSITLLISAGPRLRYLYERKVEKSLNDYNEGFESADSDSASGGSSTSLDANGRLTNSGNSNVGSAVAGANNSNNGLKSVGANPVGAAVGALALRNPNGVQGDSGTSPGAVAAYAGAGDADEADDADGDAEEVNAPEIHVGKAEVWRFNMKTDSPHDMRPKIVKLLSDLKIPQNTVGFAGIEAPGGIQFDLLVTTRSDSANKNRSRENGSRTRQRPR